MNGNDLNLSEFAQALTSAYRGLRKRHPRLEIYRARGFFIEDPSANVLTARRIKEVALANKWNPQAILAWPRGIARAPHVKLRPMFVRQPSAVEADVLGGISDWDGFFVQDWQRAGVVRGD